MSPEVSIEGIDRQNLDQIMPELLSLEANWTEVGEMPWTKKSFRKELPEKWELSVYALINNKIAGYLIGSADNGAARLNKLLVDRSFRRTGIATNLWEAFLKRCREKGLDCIDFKVLQKNKAAIDFYKSKGALFVRSETGEDGKQRYVNRYVFRTESMPHSKPSIGFEDMISVAKTVYSGELATGATVSRLISELADYVGVRYGEATNSGSNAIHLALRALGVNEASEVILPSYVCASVLSAVDRCRAKAVIADINADDCNISLSSAEKLISDRTKAIILPHVFGKPVKDTESFLSLGVPVVEDCAMAIGATHEGRKVGSFGTLSIFSFYATKVITSGVGGAVLTNDRLLARKIADLSTCDRRDSWGENYSYKMSDLQASLGLSQLRKIDGLLKRRREIAERYLSLLESADFSLPDAQENIFFRFVIRHLQKEAFMKNVQSRGVAVASPVFRPIHSYFGIPDSSFPNTSEAHKTAVSIPIYPNMSEREMEDIAGVLINWKHEGGSI